MPSSDFRHLTFAGERGKAERLFRAVISAYCALTRPTRREIAQVDDLTLPLLAGVSPEALRYAAATLSECTQAPMGLHQRLCEMPVGIAAPLLIRSPMLDDVHLLSLIGRHGLAHARAIARRKDLNPAIAHLIRALERRSLEHASVETTNSQESSQSVDATGLKADQKHSASVENARQRLRSMMRANEPPVGDQLGTSDNSKIHARLLDTALSGNTAFFHTALADALCVDISTVQSLAIGVHPSLLVVGLRALDLCEEKAFLIAAAFSPGTYAHSHAIILFLEHYRRLSRAEALNQVRSRTVDALPQAANSMLSGNPTTAHLIKSDILSA